MSSLASQKQELREKVLDRLSSIAPNVLKEQSFSICKIIEDLEDFKSAKNIAFFYALKNEVDLYVLALFAISSGKSFYPRINASNQMEFREVVNLKEDLQKGKFGVMEPSESQPLLDSLDDLDLMLVPGLGFDVEGGRLGRGGGFYDKILAELSKPISAGICFKEQLLHKVPTESWDQKVHKVIFG